MFISKATDSEVHLFEERERKSSYLNILNKWVLFFVFRTVWGKFQITLFQFIVMPSSFSENCNYINIFNIQLLWGYLFKPVHPTVVQI